MQTWIINELDCSKVHTHGEVTSGEGREEWVVFRALTLSLSVYIYKNYSLKLLPRQVQYKQ